MGDLLRALPPTIHPMLVHFPIATLYITTAFALLALLPKGAPIRPALRPLLLLSFLSVVLAVLAGFVAEAHLLLLTPAERQILERHKGFGEWTAILTLLSLLIALTKRRERASGQAAALPALSLLFLLAATLSVSAAGYFGGALVYEHGVGVAKSAGPTAELPTRRAGASLALGGTIWQNRCSACHGAATVFGGGFVARVGETTLIQFIDQNMPPGRPLSRAEAKAVVEYLKRLP